MFNRNVFLALIVAGCACHAQTPDLADARVSIPYPELKKLWEAAHPARQEKKPAPVAAAILSAQYRVALQDGQAAGSIEIDAQTFQQGWTELPLVDSTTQIERIEPADVAVVVRDGKWTLLSNKPGRLKLTLHIAVPRSADAATPRFRLPAVQAPVRTLAVTGIVAGQETEVAGATLISADKTTASYRLPAADAIDIAIRAAAEPPKPSRWTIDPVVVVNFSNNTLEYDANITAQAADGSGLAMDLRLPAGARVVEAKGDDLANWGGGRELHLAWRTRDLLTREFDVRYEVPRPATAGEWKLEAPTLAEGKTSAGLFAVAGEQGMELRAVAPPDRSLPRWLVGQTAQRNFTLVGGDGRVAVRWLPLAPTSPAVVETAQASMRIVTDGALMCEADYVIQHDRPLVWQLHLPEKTELLNCVVNGRAVSPVAREGNTIEFTLDAPGSGARTEIKVSYTGRKPAFHPVEGRVEVELPQTELLINRLDWSLQLPAAYEVVALEGNVESAPSNRTDGIALRKDLCRNERPSARLFYQKPEAKKP